MIKKIIKYAIDIVIILALALVVYYGYGKITAKYNTSAPSDEKTVYVTVEFEQHDKDILNKIQVGQEIKDGAKGDFIGTVESLTPVSDSVITVSDYKNGKYVKTTTPEYSMRTMVLKCSALVSPYEIKVNGNDIKIGVNLHIRTNEYTLNGKVIGIEIQE